MADPTSIINEIKVLLQEELGDVRESISDLKLSIVRLRGDVIVRSEFQKAVEAERDKREALGQELIALKTEQAKMGTSMKIYVGIAASVAGIIGSGLGALLFKVLG